MIIDQGDIAASNIVASAGPNASSLLEIGCGEGRITRCLHKKFIKLVAIDPDEAAIKRAYKKTPLIDFRVGSGESLEGITESFDVVVFTLSLHHQNGEKALRQVENVLNPRGKLLVVEPTLRGQMSELGYLFVDESDALEQAVENIYNSKFSIVSRKELFTTWLFGDKYELYDWIFRHYDQRPDPDKIELINAFLGETVQKQPLVIADPLVLFELSL